MNKDFISSEELFIKPRGRTLVNWTLLFESSFMEGRIHKSDAKKIISTANKYLESEPNLLYLHDPLTIVGDVHGQFYDMKEIFRLGGNPENTKYLFLGDYVDRGIYAVEILLTILALKINFPNTVFLLRGNHECRQMTTYHNFREECLKKYDQEIYDLFMECFDRMPIACIINGQFLALHGGISPDAMTCGEINQLDRFKEPPQEGAFCDILWSDPVDNQTGILKAIFEPNGSRGCSYYFGYTAISKFLKNNNLLSLIRAHEAQYEGFKAYLWQNAVFPQVITIFSAPNYCGSYSNKGAILKLKNNEMQIYQYNSTPKPDILLHLGDAFTWSIPMLSKALLDIFVGFLAHTSDVLIDSNVDTLSISHMDERVKKELNMQGISTEEITDTEPSQLEVIIEEERKRLEVLGINPNESRRISEDGKIVVINEDGQEGSKDTPVNSSGFRIMKHEDMVNEKRPTH